MSYTETRDTIAELCNKCLPMFADHWQRFPVGRGAELIMRDLATERRFWTNRDQIKCDRLDKAIMAISNNKDK